MAIVTNGAQAIGLREKHWISCELGFPCFPREFPDCSAYSCFMALEEAADDRKLELRSPHTRTWKVPVPSPWDSLRLALEGLNGAAHGRVQHEQLLPNDMIGNIAMNNPYLRSCKTETESSCGAPFEGFVARTCNVLIQFLDEIKASHLLLFPKVLHSKKCIGKFMKDEKILNEDAGGVISQINQDQKLYLVRVLLHAYREGSFEEGAVVCAPHIDDVMLWTTSKKPVAVALCEAVCLARLREEQWKAVGVRKRRKEIYVLVRNLRSTAYRLALASIVLEQWEDDLECM